MRILHATLVCLLLIPAAGRAADADEAAVAVLDRAIAAHGGAEKLAKLKFQAWKSKGTMTMGGQSMSYVADFLTAAPDRIRFDVAMEFGDQKVGFAVGSDGKTAWQSNPEVTEDMPKEKEVEFRHSIYVRQLMRLLPLKDKAFTLTALGDSKHEDKTLAGIKVTKSGQRDVSLYFDKGTGLLTRTATMIRDEFQGFKEMAQETTLSGWRDQDGCKVAVKSTVVREGKQFLVEEYSGWRFPEKVDDKKFTKPASDK